MGPRADLEAWKKRKILLFLSRVEPNTVGQSARNPVTIRSALSRICEKCVHSNNSLKYKVYCFALLLTAACYVWNNINMECQLALFGYPD